MKTIHIYEKKQQNIIQDLYKRFLKDDDQFHFFYEPDLIIRVEDKVVLANVVAYLKKKHMLFDVYDYPFPKKKDQFGEGKNAITVKYPNLFALYFHLISVTMLVVKDKDKGQIRERVIHALYNMDSKEHWDEASALANFAMRRAYVAGKYDTVEQIQFLQRREAKKKR